MATIIIDIDTDREEDVRDLANAVEQVARLVTFQTMVRSHLSTDPALYIDAESGTILNGPIYRVVGQADAFDGLSDSEVADLAASIGTEV